MATEAAKGAAFLKESKYEEAAHHLSLALKSSQAPIWLLQRATAYQRLGKHAEALIDADAAYLVGKDRARREYMATAQFRRALALHGLRRFGDARLCLNWCRKLNEKEKGLGIWQAKVKTDYERAEAEGKQEEIETSVKECPDKVEVKKEDVKKDESKPPVSAASKDKGKGKEVVDTAPAPVQATPKEKVKHEWYQSATSITITIFAKGIPKDKAEIIIKEGSLEVSFPTNATDTYDYTVSPLFAKIDPAASTYRVTPHKIEIILQKAMPSLKWSTLEGTEPIPSSTTTTDAPSSTTPIPASILKTGKAPAYPTSSRTGPKDWEKIGAEGDDAENEDVDEFFKKLYKGADPDTQKAMMKSYMESNGTALSTNWADVKKGPVKTQPPEGLVAKKWGE